MAEVHSRSLYRELRQELLEWILLPVVVIGYILLFSEPTLEVFPSKSLLGLFCLLLCLVVWLSRKRKIWANWLLVLGSMALILFAWYWFPLWGLQQALVFPIVAAGALLGPHAALLVGILGSFSLWGGITYLAPAGLDGSAPFAQMVVLWAITFVVYIAQRPYYTLVEWAWRGYEQARTNLERARDRQLKLKQALQDLALANKQVNRLNELLMAARQAVEDARKIKEEFVANVSHELRTPLNMIIGFSDMILETPEIYAKRLPPALLADIAAIRRNSQHLASLVDDVLTLSEADAGRMQLFKEWVNIPAVIREAAEAMSALFLKKGLRFFSEVDADLPAVFCDRDRIRQVLLNLLSNAGRFTESGEVKVRACRQEQEIVVCVADTGPGIEPSQVPRLFEPFQQADPSVRRRYGGSGLGLTISKRIIEMHGGHIWIESEPGKGTKVYFALPVAPAAAQETPQRWLNPHQEYIPRTRPSLAPRLTGKPCVVVIEEQESLVTLLRRYLEHLEPLAATSAAEAVALAKENAAEGVVINLPSLAQESVLAALRPLPFDIPIMFCTLPQILSPAKGMGAEAYLVKPVQRADLLRAIKEIAPAARTILLADDEAEARQLYTRMLTEGNQRVILQARDGQETLALLKEHRPDLLLLDLIMPVMDGFAVLAAKAEDPAIRSIPVIVLSAKDPHLQPLVATNLTLTRLEGLAVRDLAAAIEAMTRALRPRFSVTTDIPSAGRR
jgi:signal transduction histidine kinase/CheY-like chemotaxis protein